MGNFNFSFHSNKNVHVYVNNCSLKNFKIQMKKNLETNYTHDTIKTGFNHFPSSFLSVIKIESKKEIMVPDYNILIEITRDEHIKVHAANEQKIKRPFYLIAHRVNDKNWIEKVLKDGTNSIEIDVTYSNSDQKWYVNHDLPFGNTLAEFLLELKNFTHKCFLLMIDIKTAKSLKSLILLIRKFKLNNMGILYCLSIDDEKFIHDITWDTKENEGICIYDSNNVAYLESKMQGISNFWYANGITSFLPKFGFEKSICESIDYRNKNNSNIKKVCTWTFGHSHSFFNHINLFDIDAAIVEKNIIESCSLHIEKSPIYRLADSSDNPFERFQRC
jgi:hypothetical protein